VSTVPHNRSRTLSWLFVLLLLGGCSIGSSRQEVSTPFGYKLDCYTESITSASGQIMPGTVGSESAQQAIDTFNGDARPPGEPSVEAQADGKVVYVFTDEDGNRLGRLFVAETDQGWFVFQMERCNEEP
jgi:hypothetical protein